MRRKSEPLSAALVLASRECAWIVRAWPRHALNYTAVLPESLLSNPHSSFPLDVCFFFFFPSAWRQDKSYCNILTQIHAVSRTLCVMSVLKKYTFMPKGNRPGAFVRAIALGLEATFSLKDDEMHKTCVLRRWHTAAQAHCSTNLLEHAYSAVL